MLGTAVEVSVELALWHARDARYVDHLARTLRTIQGNCAVRFGHHLRVGRS
jgi:hypothetical protein